MRKALVDTVLAIATAICVLGCSSRASVPADVPIDCGPVLDQALCRTAAEVAAVAKINPPPIARVRLRASDPSDDCADWPQPCGPDAVIVEIQSGDTIQEVPVVRSVDGWAQLAPPG